MKINSISPLNFKKRLAACAYVEIDNKPQEAKIYELESKEDLIREFSCAVNSENWSKNVFLDGIYSRASYYSHFYKTFALEDNKGDLLSYCLTFDDFEKQNKCVAYIETAPAFTLDNKNRKLKYAGETMLAFFAKLAKIQNKNCVICNACENKTNYYTNHGFINYDVADRIMPDENYDKFIKNNECHTNGKISINL